jgi:hypothetical protein
MSKNYSAERHYNDGLVPGPIHPTACPRPYIGPNTSYSDFAIPNPPCSERRMEMNSCLDVKERPILPPRQNYLNYWEPVAFSAKGPCTFSGEPDQ